MDRNTLSNKARKALRKTVDPSGGSRAVSLLAGLTALALLTIFGVAFLVTGMSGNGGFTPDSQGLLSVGSQAPDFSTDTVNGGKVSLEDSGDYKATMLVFFASWCPHCNREAPIISDLKSQHPDLRVLMIGIDDQDNSEKVKEFVNKYNIDGPAAYDPSVGTTYQTNGYPTIYLIDSNDKITAANSGEVPKNVLEGWIEEALDSSNE